jgi:hypothetical protein
MTLSFSGSLGGIYRHRLLSRQKTKGPTKKPKYCPEKHKILMKRFLELVLI